MQTPSRALFFSLILAISACSKKENHIVEEKNKASATVEEDNLVSIPLILNIKDMKGLTEAQRRMVESIQRTSKVDYNLITEALIDHHALEYAKRTQSNFATVKTDFTRDVEHMASQLPKDQAEQLGPLKVQYEAALTRLTGKEIIYHAKSVSAPSLTKDSEMQCFSGTAFHHILMRKLLNKKQYLANNYVTIITPGHVMPGQFQGHLLTATETTAAGEAQKIIGKVNKSKQCMRVIDSSLYAVITALGGHLKDPALTAATARKATSDKYHYDGSLLNKNCAEYFKKNPASAEKQAKKGGKTPFNTSPFALSGPDAPQGKIKRIKFDQRIIDTSGSSGEDHLKMELGEKESASFAISSSKVASSDHEQPGDQLDLTFYDEVTLDKEVLNQTYMLEYAEDKLGGGDIFCSLKGSEFPVTLKKILNILGESKGAYKVYAPTDPIVRKHSQFLLDYLPAKLAPGNNDGATDSSIYQIVYKSSLGTFERFHLRVSKHEGYPLAITLFKSRRIQALLETLPLTQESKIIEAIEIVENVKNVASLVIGANETGLPECVKKDGPLSLGSALQRIFK